MFVDRARTKFQNFTNITVGFAKCHPVQYFSLTWGNATALHQYLRCRNGVLRLDHNQMVALPIRGLLRINKPGQAQVLLYTRNYQTGLRFSVLKPFLDF